jgi:hypothetical protein
LVKSHFGYEKCSLLKLISNAVTITAPPLSKAKTNENMNVQILGVLLPIIISLGAFVMIVYLRKFQNSERMLMIEKGVSPELFKNEGGSTAPTTIRWALLLMGIGTGFLMGYWLNSAFDMREVGYFSMLFIFGGLGLGLAYFFEESKNKKAK